MERYMGPAMLQHNDQAIMVDADFEFLQGSEDQRAMYRLEGSFQCRLELPGGQSITGGNSQIQPLELLGNGSMEPIMHATLVDVCDKTVHDEGEDYASQIWTILGNEHIQNGIEVPEGVNYGE
jgi:hypothetical protein